jgi:basic amino acid/polyamine antiporter, APA family
VALFVFRHRASAVPDAVPLWKFPLAPALFILASAALLYYTFSSNLRYSEMGSLVILAGIPVYYAFALRRRV